MTTPTVSNDSRLVPPDLKEWMDRRLRALKSELNCISLGTIVSFDSSTQTASISINFLKTIQGFSPIPGASNGLASDFSQAYPTLVNCPVMFLFGGGASLTFPIQPGDTCIVLFCDKDIDRWFQDGTVNPLPSQRTHDLNDGIALVGIRSLANSLESYDSSKLKILFGDGLITIDSSGNIIIQGAAVTIQGTTVSINP